MKCAAGLMVVAITGPVLGDARVRLRVDQVRGRVDRRLFGNNVLGYQDAREQYRLYGAGIWDPVKREPVGEYVELAKRAGITVMRWPGGCATHQYNWKRTVGPVEKRPKQPFGLGEFLRFCEAIDAEPMITLAAYWGGPADGADIVEYLNTPNDGSNPNGGTDYAALRAAEGHPEPHAVVWFEYGNETDHGVHGGGAKMLPAEYAKNYLAYREAMRKVDPRIRLGAHLAYGTPIRGWTRPVLAGAGKHIDFGIIHPYLPGMGKKDVEKTAPETVALAALSCGPQIAFHVRALQDMVRETTGRSFLPLAATEYNGHFVQEKPVPYRQSLVNAIRNADMLAELMAPELGVVVGNFWQYSNEYWGMVSGYRHKKERIVLQANYFVFDLYRDFLPELIAAEVTCEKFDFAGGLRVRARSGKPVKEKSFPAFDLDGRSWKLSNVAGATHAVRDGMVVVSFDGTKDLNYYHASQQFPAEPGMSYRVSAEVKLEGVDGGGIGIHAGDARGWPKTRSAAVSKLLDGTHDWTRVVADYHPLADTRAIMVMARRLEGAGVVSGRAMYRNVGVEPYRPTNFGAVPYVSVNASRSKAGDVVTAMVICRRLDSSEAIRFQLPERFIRAAAKSLTGPAFDSTNRSKPDAVGVREVEVKGGAGKFTVRVRPCSLTAVRFVTD